MNLIDYLKKRVRSTWRLDPLTSAKMEKKKEKKLPTTVTFFFSTPLTSNTCSPSAYSLFNQRARERAFDLDLEQPERERES